MQFHQFARRAVAGVTFGVSLGMISIASAPLMAQAPAQAPVAGEHGPGHGRGHGMLADLNLTDAQKAQVKAIHEKYRSQLSAGRDKAKPDLEAARAARQRGDTAAARAAFERARAAMQANKPIRDQEMAEIRNILTPEQQQKLDAHKAAWKGKKEHGQGKHRGQLKQQ